MPFLRTCGNLKLYEWEKCVFQWKCLYWFYHFKRGSPKIVFPILQSDYGISMVWQ